MDHLDWLARFDRYLCGEITYAELHAQSAPPSPTLAEACEVIEALLGERSMVSIAPWDAARAFLERVKARHW